MDLGSLGRSCEHIKCPVRSWKVLGGPGEVLGGSVMSWELLRGSGRSWEFLGRSWKVLESPGRS